MTKLRFACTTGKVDAPSRVPHLNVAHFAMLEWGF